MKAAIKNILAGVMRKLLQLKRPSGKANLKRLKRSGLTPDDFTIREATTDDIPALSALHVQTWNETYWNVKHKPTYATREYQWKEQFKALDGSWFCLLVQDKTGKLAGFARGRRYAHPNLPNYDGELNKLYLLLPYQRMGLGCKLVCAVANRFIADGINNMVLFGVPQNPSCSFHEKMGGKRLYAANGEFHGGYGWDDLQELAKTCS